MVLGHHVHTDVELIRQQEEEAWVRSVEEHLDGEVVDLLSAIHRFVDVSAPADFFFKVLQGVQRVYNVVCVELFAVGPVNSGPQVNRQLSKVAIPVPALSEPRNRLVVKRTEKCEWLEDDVRARLVVCTNSVGVPQFVVHETTLGTTQVTDERVDTRNVCDCASVNWRCRRGSRSRCRRGRYGRAGVLVIISTATGYRCHKCQREHSEEEDLPPLIKYHADLRINVRRDYRHATARQFFVCAKDLYPNPTCESISQGAVGCLLAAFNPLEITPGAPIGFILAHGQALPVESDPIAVQTSYIRYRT